MNILLDALPETVEVSGRDYPIYTDFRVWITFELMLRAKELNDTQKAALACDYYKKEVPGDIVGAVTALSQFYAAGQTEETEHDETARLKQRLKPRNKRVYDFEKDAHLIYAAFLQAYGVDLMDITYMHWWKFRALFQSLPRDTEFAHMMWLRSVDVKSVNQKDRQKLLQSKQKHAIEQDEAALSLTQRDADMKAYVQQRAKAEAKRVRGGKG